MVGLVPSLPFLLICLLITGLACLLPPRFDFRIPPKSKKNKRRKSGETSEKETLSGYSIRHYHESKVDRRLESIEKAVSTCWRMAKSYGCLCSLFRSLYFLPSTIRRT